MHGRGGAELAAMLKTWSGDVVYFADDARLTRRELRRLEAAGVALGTGPVAGLSGQDGVLEHVLLSDGRTSSSNWRDAASAPTSRCSWGSG